MNDDVFDLDALAASDQWLDDVTARTASSGDPLAASLVGWLDGIDAEYRPRPLHVAVAHPRWFARRSISLAAAGVLVLAGAGTAVAAPFSPVHRAIFGPGAPVRLVPPSVDETGVLQKAAGLVASAAVAVEHGGTRGYVEAVTRDQASADLTQASGLLSPLPGSPVRTSLEERIAMLRLELSRLPSQPSSMTPSSTTPPPVEAAHPAQTVAPQETPRASDSAPAPEPSHASTPDGGDAGDASPAPSDG